MSLPTNDQVMLGKDFATGAHGEILPLPPPPLNHVGSWRPRKNSATTPPPPLNRVGSWGSRKNYATTPPPTESRRLLQITEKTQEIQQPQLGSSVFTLYSCLFGVCFVIDVSVGLPMFRYPPTSLLSLPHFPIFPFLSSLPHSEFPSPPPN